MKVYTVLIEDRHCDPDVQVFKDKDMAVGFANDYLSRVRFPEDIEIKENPDWCLFYASYSFEGDSVTVSEHDLV